MLQNIAPIKVVHKTAEATFEFRRKKIVEKVVEPKPKIDENLRNVKK